jgi:RimJ/RimL family protein N-acetyltransferase
MSTDRWVRPVTLEGTRIRLEPLAADHLDDLGRVAFDAEIWRWTIARPIDDAGLRAWLDTALANAADGSEMPFASVDLASGRAVGSTRFLSIVPEHRRLEIGWTWLGADFQRTGLNREAKLLQLGHAFETLGAERVEFKTHASNDRSRAALLGIGASFEGVFRRHMIMPDGSRRDSAYYSVIVDEWPEVKARLVAGLTGLDGGPAPSESAPALPSSAAGDAHRPASDREAHR